MDKQTDWRLSGNEHGDAHAYRFEGKDTLVMYKEEAERRINAHDGLVKILAEMHRAFELGLDIQKNSAYHHEIGRLLAEAEGEKS